MRVSGSGGSTVRVSFVDSTSISGAEVGEFYKLKAFADDVNSSDALTASVILQLADQVAVSDDVARLLASVASDLVLSSESVSTGGSFAQSWSISPSDVVSLSDLTGALFGKGAANDPVSVTESIAQSMSIAKADSVTTSEAGTIQLNPYAVAGYWPTDYVAASSTVNF